MIKDPRQIVTPFAFEVHPDLLGLPLATPKRRLAAILLDLIIASILTSLGNMVLALGVAVLFFWIAVRTRGSNTFYNFLRFSGAGLASILVFGLALGIIEGMDPADENISKLDEKMQVKTAQDVDWAQFGKAMASMDYTDEDALERDMEKIVVDMGLVDTSTSKKTIDYSLPDTLPAQLTAFISAIESRDSVRVDSLREVLAPIVAKVELDELENDYDRLDNLNDKLADENDELTEQVNNPSLFRTLKTWFSYMGLSLGWIGIYFIATNAFFRGQTLGKRFLKLRVVRLNNKPLGLYFAFERFGGYAAGLATGLLGFFQMFWDANRQAIHDKIAGTVVVDLRPSKMNKTEALRREILQEENLLADQDESDQY